MDAKTSQDLGLVELSRPHLRSGFENLVMKLQ